MKIVDLFPTPIGLFHNNNTTEHNLLLDYKFINHPYYENFIVSEESNILNENKNTLPVISDFIKKSLDEYSQATLATTQPLYITQSWLTKHEEIPQFTFPHRHQNSIISGCYYVLASEKDAGINFHREENNITKYIKWEQEEHLSKGNKFVWERVEINVETGVLVLFPSWITHSVSGSLQKNSRCSLAFNTWFDGPIGNKDAFTLL